MFFEITKENFKSVRENGIGFGFTVLNPADGYRKDDRLWFGTCSECGESVTNSALTGRGWVHTIRTVHAWSKDGRFPVHSSSVESLSCPKVGG